MAVYKFTTNKAVDFAIMAGHGTSEKDGGYDSGAVGSGKHEHDLVEYVALQVCEKLSNAGYDVFYDEQNFKDNDLAGVTIKSKFALSLHANAHNTQARGVEALVPAKESKLDFEFNVTKRIAALGTPNRGVKSREYSNSKTHQRTNGVKLNFTDYYGEIRDAWNRGISLTILEMFFIDNNDDLAFYNKHKETIIDIIVDELKKVAKPSGTPVQPVQPTPAPETPKPAVKKEYIQLPKTENSWRVYPLNKKPVVGNEVGVLNPKKFGGLEYEVLRWTQADVAVISTRDFGQVQIYVAASTGAKRVTK